MKKIISLLGIAAYVLAFIGGCGYTIQCNAIVITVAIVALAGMALPTLAECWRILTKE